MVTKIHARGSSFRGAAAYLLHDKNRAKTATRVAWAETVNLLTRNPEAAWRVMAATAMDAARLKDDAGVKKTGRQSKDAVLHVSLSWDPDQTPGRADMTAFAHRALAALKAQDRQAMIICHDDERHPHVHLLINRVSPVDGRLLSSSNEKNALSALALAYEQECGRVLCEQRQANAERRAKGEYVRAEKDVPRAEFEALREAQEAAEAEIDDRIPESRHEDIREARRQSLATFRVKLAELKAWLRPHWAAMYARQRTEAQAGQQEKRSLLESVAGWIGYGRPGPSVSLPFMRQSLRGIGGQAKGRSQRQEGERATLARAKGQHMRELLAEAKRGYASALGKLRSAYAAPARPQAPLRPDWTPAQRQAADYNRQAVKPNATKGRSDDREFEP